MFRFHSCLLYCILCNSTSLVCCTTGGIIYVMTRTLYHKDDSVTMILSETMTDFLGGKAIIHMTAEEHENLERHVRESNYQPPPPLLPHELAEMFGDDEELGTYLESKRTRLMEEKEHTFIEDAELPNKYPKFKDKDTIELLEWSNERKREDLQHKRDEVERLLAFMGRGGSRKIKNFQLDLARAKAFPIDPLLDFSKNRIKTQCVWHEDKDPSLHYYRKNNTVWCFACEHGGDALDVVMQMKGCALPEAINFINQGRT